MLRAPRSQPRLQGALSLLILTACPAAPEPPCAEVDLDVCDATEGCKVQGAYRYEADTETAWSCWRLDQLVPHCVAEVSDGCGPRWRPAGPPGSDPTCLLFDDQCIPERWQDCDAASTDDFCPRCTSDEVPPWRGPDRVLTGPEGFGTRVAITPDLTGDGAPDLVVSARWELSILHGPPTDTSPRLLSSFPRDESQDARFVAADLTGDGVTDLAIGLPGLRRPPESPRRGGVAIFQGPIDELSVAAAYALRHGAEVNHRAGDALHLADLDGDGAIDLLVTSTGERPTGARPGSLAVLLAPVQAEVRTLGEPTLRLLPADGTDGTLALHDIDGDGQADLVIPAGPSDLLVYPGPFVDPLREPARRHRLTHPVTGLLSTPDALLAAQSAWSSASGALLDLTDAWPTDVTAALDPPRRQEGRCEGDAIAKVLAGGGGMVVIASPHAANAPVILRHIDEGRDDPRVTDRGLRLGTHTIADASFGDLDGDGHLDVALGVPDRREVHLYFGPFTTGTARAFHRSPTP